MPDQRSKLEKLAWDLVGPPLYYSADCLRPVKVTAVEGAEPIIERPCGPGCGCGIIAPRKAVCTGKGGADLPVVKRAELALRRMASDLTQRSV